MPQVSTTKFILVGCLVSLGGIEKFMSVQTDEVGRAYSLDTEGLFWLASNPDVKRPGRLRYTGTDEAILEVTVGDLVDGTPGDHETHRIQGMARSEEYTLDSCRLVGHSMSSFTSSQRFRVPLVIAGAIFDQNEPLEFSAAMLEFRFLDQWLNLSGLQWTNRDHMQFQLTWTPVDIRPVHGSDRIVKLIHYCNANQQQSSGSISESWEIGIGFPALLPLRDIQRYCYAVQHLVTISKP